MWGPKEIQELTKRGIDLAVYKGIHRRRSALRFPESKKEKGKKKEKVERKKKERKKRKNLESGKG